MKIVFMMRSLEVGGAERLVLDLAKKIPDVYLVTLYGGAFEEEARQALSERLVVLQGSKIKKFQEWIKFLKNEHPNAVYAHLGEAQLLSLMARFYGARAIWCLHSTNLDWTSIGKVGELLFKLLAKLSIFANACVAVCDASLEFHKNNGYRFKKSIVIYPGVDTTKFYPMQKDDRDFCLVGISARLDPIKGYDVFAKAARIVCEKLSNVKFISAGTDNAKIRNECIGILGEYSNRFTWLGKTRDMNAFYNLLDVAVSSSHAEAFSIAILEAMSCNKTVVATNVGNSALIIGDEGLIVLPDDANILALTIIEALTLKFNARTRIEKLYSIDACAIETVKFIKAVSCQKNTTK